MITPVLLWNPNLVAGEEISELVMKLIARILDLFEVAGGCDERLGSHIEWDSNVSEPQICSRRQADSTSRDGVAIGEE
ncbi:hypothetical protein ACH5RR_020080 [Cinchona calisaya]|uniref:Uncharacterized protein n=1 Tax=Cinchona calisaya TaxID=153742 RepID=A0ABD2ZDE2_9GENT